MKPQGTKRWLLAALAAAFVISYFSSHYNRYYLGVAMDVGIAVIMAVSLNLINGYTGQFSLGHVHIRLRHCRMQTSLSAPRQRLPHHQHVLRRVVIPGLV